MLALGKIVLKSLPGIDRPAMAGIAPSARGDVVMLDLGANVRCDPRNLVEFAIMGDAFARTVLGLTAPTIGELVDVARTTVATGPVSGATSTARPSIR